VFMVLVLHGRRKQRIPLCRSGGWEFEGGLENVGFPTISWPVARTHSSSAARNQSLSAQIAPVRHFELFCAPCAHGDASLSAGNSEKKRNSSFPRNCHRIQPGQKKWRSIEKESVVVSTALSDEMMAHRAGGQQIARSMGNHSGCENSGMNSRCTLTCLRKSATLGSPPSTVDAKNLKDSVAIDS
jgi:hypothetical protein